MFGNFSIFKTPFQGRSSVPPSFVSFFIFYIFSYLLLKTMGCFSGCLMSSAGIQKFCGIYLAFKCPFAVFVGEKVFSPSYSSAILAPPCLLGFLSANKIDNYNTGGKKKKQSKRIHKSSQKIRIINVFLESLLSESFPHWETQSTLPP